MKLADDLEKAFNDQITLEFEASMVYRQLSIEMELRDLPGMASWLRQQAEEELAHGQKFIEHLTDRDNHPQIGTIHSPKLQINSVLECFQAAYAHEQKVSASIRELVGKAEKNSDYDSRPLLDWFLAEQIEEEATASEIVGRLELVGDDASGLLRIDAELGERSSV